jgi:hypothetical protein
MDPHLIDVDPCELAALEPVSTSHLDEQDPVSTPCLDEPDFDTQDIESAAIHAHDVSPVDTARFDSAALHLEHAGKGASVLSASAQAHRRFRCGMNRRDGSLCHETFATRYRMHQHQSSSAHIHPVPCPFCQGRLRQPRSLFSHVQKFHPEKLWTNYRCRVCGSEKLSTLWGLVLHVWRYHEELSLQERYNVTRGF